VKSKDKSEKIVDTALDLLQRELEKLNKQSQQSADSLDFEAISKLTTLAEKFMRQSTASKHVDNIVERANLVPGGKDPSELTDAELAEIIAKGRKLKKL
jgi:esterase/lipase